jgi:hypothetical protein
VSTDFALAIEQGLNEGRELAESLMVDTCLITKAGAGDPVFDKDTGQYTDPARVTVYEGKCRIQIASARDSSSRTAGGGERDVTTQEPELHLPIDGTDGVSVDQVAEITTAAHDASMVGRQFTIVARHEKSLATARRLRVIEVTG